MPLIHKQAQKTTPIEATVTSLKKWALSSYLQMWYTSIGAKRTNMYIPMALAGPSSLVSIETGQNDDISVETKVTQTFVFQISTDFLVAKTRLYLFKTH